MKIELIQDHAVQETEITIRCPELTDDILRIMTMLRIEEHRLIGESDGEIRVLDSAEVLYAESSNKRTVLFTFDREYKSALRLYELEEKLREADFFRVSKSCVINFRQIQSIRPDIGGQLTLIMADGKKIWVSRQYSTDIKNKLKSIERSFKK